MKNPLAWLRPKSAGDELRLFGICFGIGLLILPLAIYLVGRNYLGAYPNGGLGTLWLDYCQALLSGRVAQWLVALGPYLAIMLVRALWWGQQQLRP